MSRFKILSTFINNWEKLGKNWNFYAQLLAKSVFIVVIQKRITLGVFNFHQMCILCSMYGIIQKNILTLFELILNILGYFNIDKNVFLYISDLNTYMIGHKFFYSNFKYY